MVKNLQNAQAKTNFFPIAVSANLIINATNFCPFHAYFKESTQDTLFVINSTEICSIMQKSTFLL